MNDFERKLRETPLRQPPVEWRDEILETRSAKKTAADNPPARCPSATSPQRRFGKTDSGRTCSKARPLLAFLLKPTSIFFIFIATIVTGGGALFVGANSAGKTSWERYSDEARARGVKMSLKELLPAPIPDAENFAAVPLIANLFSEDEAVRQKAASAFEIPERRPISRLAYFGDPIRCDLAGWQADFVKSGDLPAASPDTATDVLRAIEYRFGPALAELAEAERRPGAVFPVKWELGFAVTLPHLELIQRAARVHALRMAARLAQRNAVDAYAEFRGIMRLCRALEKEPTMIDGLVRISILNMAVSGVWEGVVTSAWDAHFLEEIEGDLSSLDLLADGQFAFESERAGMNDMLESTRSGKSPFNGAERDSGLGLDPARLMLLRAVPKIPGWISINQVAMNRFYDQFPARIDINTARFHDTGSTTAELEMINRSILKQHIYVLYRTMVPSMGVVEKKFLYAHAALQITALACALERHRLAEGAYPETLAALTPKYVTVLPHDVITGAPLIYRRTADGHFLLYSVGMNGTDDGGAPAQKKSGSEQLDWAWCWPAESLR